MSNLNHGGYRGVGARVFGARQIARACQDYKKPDVDKANGSIATGKDGTTRPHNHSREVQRRLRQEARKAARGG